MSYRFHEYELDPARRLLLHGSRLVRLQPKVFELLHFLVLHRTRVVPKAVLLRELWPDAYVTAASLTRLVKEARRAVGDDGRRQRVIHTMHGFGYRFVAALSSSEAEDANEGELAIELAQRTLEASLELGAQDLRARVREFAEACLLVVRSARRTATG
jgi:DNA-binding winged helix-turn-helix (wHTH) protein